MKYAISALNVHVSPKFPRVVENRGRGTRWWRQIFDRKKYAIWSVFMAESPKFQHLIGNRGRRTRWWRQILTESRNKTDLRMHNEKYAIWPLVMAESFKVFADLDFLWHAGILLYSFLSLYILSFCLSCLPFGELKCSKLLHRSAMDLWTRLWRRYHVPQNVFLVNLKFLTSPDAAAAADDDDDDDDDADDVWTLGAGSH